MLRWGQAAMQVIGPLNQRTAENFPIAGELYGWCSERHRRGPRARLDGPRHLRRRGPRRHPAGHGGAHHPPVPRRRRRHDDRRDRQHRRALRAHPDQFELVREDPSLVPAAFAEVLRYWAPVHAWGRKVTRDVEIDGALVPAGAQVAILFGAGNRDPRHYDDPDTFLVERNPVDHLSFGYGPHGCAGQGLARLEGTPSSRRWPAGRSAWSWRRGPRAEQHHPQHRELPVLEVVPA